LFWQAQSMKWGEPKFENNVMLNEVGVRCPAERSTSNITQRDPSLRSHRPGIFREGDISFVTDFRHSHEMGVL
jgi:hypothetical protein